MRASWACLPWALAACQPEFAPASRVDKLRVLAVRSDPAAARPGETVLLTPLVADPRGGGRAPAFAWDACVTFAEGAPVVVLPEDCAVATAGLPPLGGSATLAWVVPAEVEALADAFELTDESGALTLPVRLVVSAGDERARVIVPVAVALGDRPPNRNPTLRALVADGAAWSAEDPPRALRVGRPLVLAASWTADSAEPFSASSFGSEPDREVVEVPAVRWFVTDGELDPDVTSAGHPEAEWTVDEPPPGGTATVWAVLEDGRGGVAWAVRQVAIEPAAPRAARPGPRQ